MTDADDRKTEETIHSEAIANVINILGIALIVSDVVS